MLLQRLKEYAGTRMTLPPENYDSLPVRYIFEIDLQGRPLKPDPSDTADKANKATQRGERRLTPYVPRTGDFAFVLADHAEYVFGIPRPKTPKRGEEPEPPGDVSNRKRLFRERLERCFAATGAPEVEAVRLFLEHHAPTAEQLGPNFDPAATITFRVHTSTGAVFPTDLPAVQAFWAAENDPETKGAEVLQCVVCGETRPALQRMQGKIKGLTAVGGQGAGTAIISADKDAFESYGLENSYIAPTCRDCARGFTAALNDLLAGERSRRLIGGAMFVYWTRQPVSFDLWEMLSQPAPEQVSALLETVRAGRSIALDTTDTTAFYAAALTATGGRVVVRDWIDTTLGEVKEHLGRWFLRQQVTGAWGEPPEAIPLWKLAAATISKKRKNEQPPAALTTALLRCAIAGTHLHAGLLAQALRPTRTDDEPVPPERAALIKLILSEGRTEEEIARMTQLDPTNDSPAYRCGRLLAELENTQRQALGQVNATIVDRFYGTASSAPATVFGRLVRGAQHHLGALRDTPAHSAIQQQLEEIMSGIPDFPKVLTLEDQGRFALGYYFQRAQHRARITAAREARRAAQGEQRTEEQN